jgi:hypothetical protein
MGCLTRGSPKWVQHGGSHKEGTQMSHLGPQGGMMKGVHQGGFPEGGSPKGVPEKRSPKACPPKRGLPIGPPQVWAPRESRKSFPQGWALRGVPQGRSPKGVPPQGLPQGDSPILGPTSVAPWEVPQVGFPMVGPPRCIQQGGPKCVYNCGPQRGIPPGGTRRGDEQGESPMGVPEWWSDKAGPTRGYTQEGFHKSGPPRRSLKVVPKM